jgi:CRISPR/Cas system-associated exonuclease Cas4 (RecB family)
LKTTRFLYPSKMPYGSHALQVNIYAYLLGKMGRPVNRLQIQYLDMSGPTKCRKCRVPVIMVDGEFKCPNCQKFFADGHLGACLIDVRMMGYDEIKENLEARRNELQTAMTAGMPPAREPGFLCSYCGAFNTCGPEVNED